MTIRHVTVALSILCALTACKSGQSQQETASGASSAEKETSKVQKALDDPDNLLTRRQSLAYPSGEKKGGTLRRSLNGEPRGFNWLVENSAQVAEIQKYVHSSVAARSGKNPDNWIPDLAYKVTANDNFTEYTVHIRKNVQWQRPSLKSTDADRQWLAKNHAVDAGDFKFFFEMIQNPRVAAGAMKSFYQDVERVEVIDDHTFKVIWTKKTHQSLWATMTAYPLPEHIFTRTKSGERIPESELGIEFNTHWAGHAPIGTGPYKMTEYDDNRVVLERFADYFGPEPPIHQIEYKSILQDQTYSKLENGELDIGTIGPEPYKRHVLEGDADSPFENGTLKHQVVDRFAYHYIGWNLAKPMFASKLTRQALTHALDRQAIIKNVYHGLGHIQTGPFYRGHRANSPKVQPHPHTLKEARKLLDTAGWKQRDNDGIREKKLNGEMTDFRFTISIYRQSTWRRIAAMYRSDLRKIGIDMDVEAMSWPAMQKKMNDRDFDAYTGGWALSWSIDPYQIWHSSQAKLARGSNKIGFKNKRADRLIETLRTTFDDDRRIELARDFHELIHRQQPYTFVRAPQQVYAWNTRVKNIQFRPIRPQDLSFRWYLAGDQ